jgi:Family of unknown function (DUF6492)
MAPVQHVYLSGWLKQQLLKLACSEHVATPWYLVTDADMLYLNDTSAADLLEVGPCGEGMVCTPDRSKGYRARNELQSMEVLKQSVEQVGFIFGGGDNVVAPHL